MRDSLRIALLLAGSAFLCFANELKSPDDWLAAGLESAKQQRWGEAADALLQGESLAPRDIRFQVELAGVAYRQNRIEEAKRRLHRALGIDPQNVYANDFLAHLYFREGNLQAALRYWNRIDKPRVRKLVLDQSPPITPDLLRRAVTISNGSVLSEDDLLTTSGNLERLDVFGSHRVNLLAREEQEFDVELQLMDRQGPSSGWIARLAPIAAGLPYQTVVLDLNNIRRSGTNFRSLVRWDPDKRMVAASLSGPLIGRPKWRYTIGGSARQELWDLRSTYNAPLVSKGALPLEKVSIDVGVEQGINSRLSWSNIGTFSHRSYKGIVDPNDPLFASGAGLKESSMLRYRLIDEPAARLTLDTLGGVEVGTVLASNTMRFTQLQAGLNFRWDINEGPKRLTMTSSARAAMTFGDMPFDEYSMLGMERDNSLWLRGHVGTFDGRKGNAPLGTDYVLFANDLKKTVYRNALFSWSAGPLFDIGSISDPTGKFGSKGWLYDTGVESQWRFLGGLTFVLTYGYDIKNGNNVVYTAIRR